jgi:hypothetical protein
MHVKVKGLHVGCGIVEETSKVLVNTLLILGPRRPYTFGRVVFSVGNEGEVGVGGLKHYRPHHHILLVRQDVTVVCSPWKFKHFILPVTEVWIYAF